MKSVPFALVTFLSSFVSAEAGKTIDRHQIKPLNFHVKPIGSCPAKEPGLRVVGGKEAAVGQFPYQLYLILNKYDSCGGSLISKTAALTAGHCLNGVTDIQVIAGVHNRDEKESSQVVVTSTSHIVHSGYKDEGLKNDIAVVRFNALSLNDKIQVINLAPVDIQNIAGQTAVLSGWGTTSDDPDEIGSMVLRYVELTIMNSTACRDNFNSIDGGVDGDADPHVCTSGQGKRGGCYGDSGGPLVLNKLQIGVVSYGGENCEAGQPTVYSSVSFYRNWISQNAGV